MRQRQHEHTNYKNAWRSYAGLVTTETGTYLSATDGRATQQAVMAFTHDDVYKPMPGYKVLVSHFHFHFNEQLTDAGTLDEEPTWVPVFRELGVNLAILADFHSDSHPNDTGKMRLDEQKVYFQGCERFSDRLGESLGPRYAVFNFGEPGAHDPMEQLAKSLSVSPDFVALF